MKSLLVVLLSGLAWAGAPTTPPPLAEASGDLDGDGRPERVHLEADGSLRVDDAAGRELGRVALPAGPKGTVAIVDAEEHPVVWARVPIAQKGRTAEAVVQLADGKLEPIYNEVTGPMGDGGWARRLRVDEAGVVQWQIAPTVARCDGNDMLFPQRWDFDGRRFRAVDLEVPQAEPLAATKSAPAPFLPEPLGMFHFTAASTSPDAERHADRLGAPRELDDAKTDTFWVAGSAAGGRGAWVTARAPASDRRLQALKIVPGPGWPRALVLLAGTKAFRVTLAGPQAVWVALPDVQAACVSLVVAEPHGKGADTSLAEVTIFTDVDVPGGLEQLVETVAADQPGAHGAEEVLSRRGADAARAIAARLEKSQAGRRRLLATLAALKVPEAAAPLGKALQTAHDDERALIVDGLVKLGAAGAAEALRVYQDASQAPSARQDAAEVLGAAGGEAEVAALIAGAGGLPGASLRALHKAMAREASVAARVAASLDGNDGCGVEIGVWARLVPGSPAVEKAWSRCASSKDFALRLRLARSLKSAASLAQAARDDEPMVRQAAVEAGGPLLLADRDPGVRRASLARADGPSAEAALQKDAWPLVRRAAAEALGRHCGNLSQALANAVEKDPAEEVRREALVALAHCGPVPLQFLARVLKTPAQPVAVRELAAALAAKQGGPEAARLLADAVDDVLSDPAADERSASLAIACLRGLGRMKDGSTRVLEALGAAANEPLSPAVRAASMEAIGQICPAGAGEALAKGRRDPDPMVRRAAQQALDKCKR